MGRKRISTTVTSGGDGVETMQHQQQQMDNGVGSASRTNSRTTIEEQKSTHQSHHSKDCTYDYVEDSWERFPKTDYTYSKSGSYIVEADARYMSPNMSRSSLRLGAVSDTFSSNRRIAETKKTAFGQSSSQRRKVGAETQTSRASSVCADEDEERENYLLQSSVQRQMEKLMEKQNGEFSGGGREKNLREEEEAAMSYHRSTHEMHLADFSDDEITDRGNGPRGAGWYNGRAVRRLTWFEYFIQTFGLIITNITTAMKRPSNGATNKHDGNNGVL